MWDDLYFYSRVIRTVALLLTRVSNVTQILLHITTGDNLHDHAAIRQTLLNGLDDYSARHENWRISEGLRLFKQEQDREFEQGLNTDR